MSAPAVSAPPSCAIRIATDAMEPKYCKGFWLLLEEAAKPVVGDAYVFAKADNNTKVATLRAVSRGRWKVDQYNRKGSLSLPRTEWRPLWHVVGWAHKGISDRQMRGEA